MKNKKKNNNCLENLSCPACGQDDEFMVAVSTWMELSDEGTGFHGDVYYDETSGCRCYCGWSGVLGDTDTTKSSHGQVKATKTRC